MKNSEINKPLDFGDYCKIEMYRYGSENEFYIHKVISRFDSTHAAKVPIKYGSNGTGTNSVSLPEMSKVLNVIQCGISETKVFKVRECDVVRVKSGSFE